MTSIKELTRRLGIPYHFLAKILQGLKRKGLLNSLKGPTGGFALAIPAKKITLLHIVEAIDGVGFARNCVMGFAECSGKNPCAMHDKWGAVRDSISSLLVTKSIGQMANEMGKPEYKRIATRR